MIEFGFYLPYAGPRATPPNVARLALLAEECGYDHVAVGGHLVYPRTIVSRYPYSATGTTTMDPTYANLGPLSTLAWVGALTSRVRLHTRVVPLPVYSPFELAKDAATVDFLSGGRLVLGVGSGWMKEEFDVANVRFSERGAMVDEAIGVMRALWSGDGRFSGPSFSFSETCSAPAPVQDPLPIWIVGSNERTLARLAKLGQGLLVGPGNTPDSTDYWDRVDRALATAGRARSELNISTDVGIAFESGSSSSADVEAICTTVERWAAVGANSFNVGFGVTYEQPIELLVERVQWFADNVLPSLRRVKPS